MVEVKKTERFSDNGELIYEFSDEFLVVCPKCKSMAKVLPNENKAEKWRDYIFLPRRLVCLNCIFQDISDGKSLWIGASVDWYFRFPLWLEISCCGEKLWAYNEKHLEFIENYVAAKLRKRKPNVNKSLTSRFPNWIKKAKNRGEILKAIEKLREKLNGKS